MAIVKAKCRRCRSPLTIPADKVGHLFACPICKNKMIFTEQRKLVNYTESAQKREVHEATHDKSGLSKEQVRKILFIVGACLAGGLAVYFCLRWFMLWLSR